MSTSISATEIGLPDNAKLKLGTGEDLEIYHDGTNTYLDNNTGQFNIDAASGNAIRFLVNGSYQCQVYTSGIDLPDNKKLRLGDSEDLQIYHNGTNSYVRNSTGQLLVGGSGGDLLLEALGDVRTVTWEGENMIYAKRNGAVELYHDNTKKLSTNADGIEVHGSTDSARIEFGDAYSNSRIGYFGLNRFGIDGHDGLEVRDPSASYAVRMRITATGQFKAFSDQASGNGQLLENISSTNPEGLYIKFSQAAPNTQSRHFIKCSDNVGDKAVIDSNGNSRNLNNSYGGFSDISLKENIVDAGSQWDDIKNVKVRVFNFKTDSASEKRIGVVAQEIETVCPKLVGITYDKDEDGNMLETGVKSVKYSVLYMKAIKALQEAIIKIEVLETKVETLEAA